MKLSPKTRRILVIVFGAAMLFASQLACVDGGDISTARSQVQTSTCDAVFSGMCTTLNNVAANVGR